MAKKHLAETVSAAQTEEELKFFFAKHFDLPVSTKNRIDLYTEQILFEFKLDDNLKNLQTLAKTVAQALYYVRRLKFGDDERAPSQNICVITKNLAAFFTTDDFAAFFNNPNYDWDLKPSKPCKKLVDDLASSEIIIHAHVYDFANFHDGLAFETLINNTRKRKSALFNVKKQINQQNFYQVFQYWQSFFGADVANGHKPSEYFLIDIEQGKSHINDGKVYFEMTGEQIIRKPLNPDEYNYFWSQYAKISSAREIIAIRQKMDRITEINLRRFTGEFYTPIDFAKKAFDYLTRTVNFGSNFRIWDMAAGTGNLEFAIPPDAIKFCYISTLIEDEAKYCKQIFSDATVFQYDFLNDGEDKLPQNLRDDLNNPEITWIIFINPPYATANNKDTDKTLVNKSGISMTAIRELMIADNLKVSSQELTTQFLYRISRDFANRKAWLGIFSKLAYIQTSVDQKIRDSFFQYKFERGFMLSSQNFQGCKGKFPVGFIVWNLGERISLVEQTISLDIYDSTVEKIGEKIIYSARSENFLNKWIERPRCTKKFPPMVSGLNFGFEHNKRVDRVAEGFLAGFMIKGNDFLNQNSTALLSAPYASHAGFSITEKNFEQAMIVHMVRRLPKATRLNDRDQFLQPTKPLTREFITDAVIWSLFAPSNQTVSLRNVEYEGATYQIVNNLYPFKLSEVRSWECSSIKIAARLETATSDRFAALWVKNNPLSAQAQAVLDAGRAIYKKFYAELSRLDVRKFKIEDWDAGWYQIRMSLGASINLSELSAKLEPQIYELGFLRDEVRYF